MAPPCRFGRAGLGRWSLGECVEPALVLIVLSELHSEITEDAVSGTLEGTSESGVLGFRRSFATERTPPCVIVDDTTGLERPGYRPGLARATPSAHWT
jgi:hypothetical protein